MTSGFVLGPGEGSAYGFHGSAAVIKASGEDTLGQLGVIESVYPYSAGRIAGPWAGVVSSSCRATGRMASPSAAPARPAPW